MPAACRAGVAHHPDKPIAPPTMADCLLVVAAVALALGLGAVTASLAPGTGDRGDVAPERPTMVMTPFGAPWPGASRKGSAGPPAMPRILDDELASSPGARVSATGSWNSPLYPQNGVSLWDRIRVSSRQDRRAFLLGTAIQVHARATAALPGSRAVVPPCCPRS